MTKKENTYTIIKGSIREFNIRWYGYGFTTMLFGLFVGYMVWG